MGAVKLSYYENTDEQSERSFACMMVVQNKPIPFTTHGDYYTFGSPMPGRTFTSATSYRYGFNGKEKDNEISGNGNSYDYGFRIYNPRLGRFLSVDPLTKSYPWYTPYQFAGNMPIMASDIDGLEENAEIRWYENGKYTGSTVIQVPEKYRIEDKGTLVINLHKSDKPEYKVGENQYAKKFDKLLFYTKDGTRKLMGGEILAESNNKGVRDQIKGLGAKDKFGRTIDAKELRFDEIEIGFTDPRNITKPIGNAEKLDPNTVADNPEFQFDVKGYASEGDGATSEQNQKYSEGRANTVKDALLKGGGDPSHVKAKGMGTTNTGEKLQDNRKAVISTTIPKDKQYD